MNYGGPEPGIFPEIDSMHGSLSCPNFDCLCFNIWGESSDLCMCIGKASRMLSYLHNKLPTVGTKKPEDQSNFDKIIEHAERTIHDV